jgi:hypothetical protein
MTPGGRFALLACDYTVEYTQMPYCTQLYNRCSLIAMKANG